MVQGLVTGPGVPGSRWSADKPYLLFGKV